MIKYGVKAMLDGRDIGWVWSGNNEFYTNDINKAFRYRTTCETNFNNAIYTVEEKVDKK